MLNRLLRILILVLVSSAAAAQTAPQSEFALKFDDHGITSLKHVGDKYDTDYIAQDATLGHVVIGYKMGENDWREFSTHDPANKLDRLRYDRSPRWAKDYDGVRQILLEEGVPDVQVVRE